MQRENTTHNVREFGYADVAMISSVMIALCIHAIQFLIGSNFQTYVEITDEVYVWDLLREHMIAWDKYFERELFWLRGAYATE